MRKLMVALVVILCLGGLALQAQTADGKRWEFSTAISYDSFSGGEMSETYYAWNVPFRIGGYIWKGLEIQPELMLTKFKHSDTGYLLSANFLYNFDLKKKGFVPFVLVGAGFGNGFPYVGIVEGDSDTKTTFFNAGAGLKYFIAPSAALRLDYRYSRLHMSSEGYGTNYNKHSVFVGVSVFF